MRASAGRSTNEGLAREAWNKGLTGSSTNEGFRSANGTSHMVAPSPARSAVNERGTGRSQALVEGQKGGGKD